MILVVIILLTAFVAIPNLSTSIKNSAAIEKEKLDNKTLNEKLGELLLSRDEYNLLNAEYQKYLLQLPSENDISIFTNEIYDIAEYSNVGIYSIDYIEKKASEEEEGLGLAIVEADLILQGSYYNIMNFINTMERMPRIVKIENLIIQSTEEKYDNLSAYVKARLYYNKV